MWTSQHNEPTGLDCDDGKILDATRSYNSFLEHVQMFCMELYLLWHIHTELRKRVNEPGAAAELATQWKHQGRPSQISLLRGSADQFANHKLQNLQSHCSWGASSLFGHQLVDWICSRTTASLRPCTNVTRVLETIPDKPVSSDTLCTAITSLIWIWIPDQAPGGKSRGPLFVFAKLQNSSCVA